MKKSSRFLGLLFVLATLIGSQVLAEVNPVLLTNLAPTSGFGALAVSDGYLYSAGDAFRIFDISNRANPVQVGTVNVGSSGLALSGNHALVLNGSLHSYYGAILSIFDVSDPANPISIGEIPGSWFSVAASGRFVYLGGGSGPTGYWVSIYDISDPANPASVGRINTGGFVTSIVVRNNFAYMVGYSTWLLVSDVSDPFNPITPQQNAAGAGFDVALSGNFACIATGFTNTLEIYDISNQTNHFIVSNPLAYGQSVTVSGNYAYVVGGNFLSIVNISNPTNASIVLSDNALPPGFAQPHMAAVSGNYAYVGTVAGLRVYYLAMPAPPLGISSSTSNILLSWPTPTGAFEVQQSPDLHLANWITLTNRPVVVGSKNQVAIPKPDGTMFYRLALQ